jgi:ubiquinone/menaquinone biosynthesis C-methylase UbiE/uncharacterized membrane protein YbhN (UPF0104 family)
MPGSLPIDPAPQPPRRISRATRLLLAFFAAAAVVGGAATLYAMLGDDPSLRAPRPAVLLVTSLVAITTIVNLFLRFVRWHYLLRRLDIRLYTIPSLGAFVGSFAFLPVPLYLGQLVARRELTSGFPRDRRGYLVLTFLWERTLDAGALALLAIPTLGALPATAALLLLLAVLLPVVRVAVLRRLVSVTNYVSGIFSDEHRVDPDEVVPVLAGRSFAIAALLSIATWLPTATAFAPLAQVSGVDVGWIDALSAAARSILLGAMSLSPIGAGVAGFVLFAKLQDVAGPFAHPSAVAEVVFLYRAATVWLTVAIGAVALLVHRSVASRPTHHDHFDEIDECYDAWLPEHIRDHVVGRKVDAMRRHLSAADKPLRGLDIGCGRGWYLEQILTPPAIGLVGLDNSIRQIDAAKEYVTVGVPLVQGTVLALPFAEATFDFAYIINVLHHMPSKEHQLLALTEMARVIRPGGKIFVHEFNVSNPLFRFYLSYVFPILKGIEEGTEPYMDPRTLVRVPGLDLLATEYFSFLPDFIPASLIGPASALERRLEQTRFVRYSAHFMGVFQRPVE